MLWTVIDIETHPGFLLHLEFANGERRCFDIKPYLHYSVYRRLENPGFFACARGEHGTVVWPDDIDIAPKTLYELSLPSDAAG